MGKIPFEVDLGKKVEEDSDRDNKQNGKPPESKKGEKVWSVSQLTRRIKGLLEDALPLVLVEGEISSLKQATSGHLYFNLKDKNAQIRCVMFRSAASSLRFSAEDGLQVALRGRLSVYEARGEYQLQALTMSPKGAGALQLAFEQLKRKLEEAGLFDQAAKKPLPFLPHRIGIVTSPSGAAIRDMLQVLERRFPGMPVLIHPATVQGDQAAGEIAKGIATLNRLAPEKRIDVIIIGRGGGSAEDLWAFNEEVVARAIFASKVPIVSAVGHETDFTIADFVADVRAPTPSAAAEIVVPNRDDLQATVIDLRNRFFQRMEDELELGRERWSGMRARLGSPEDQVGQLMQRVDDLRERAELSAGRMLVKGEERLRQSLLRLTFARPDRFNRLHRSQVRGLEGRLAPALRRHVNRKKDFLATQSGLLDSLGPLTIMKRGYGAVLGPGGNLVRSVKEVSQGDSLKLRLHDGTIDAEAKNIIEKKD